MDGVIVGGWGWVATAYASAGVALAFYVYSLSVRRRRIEAKAPFHDQRPSQDQKNEHGTHDTDA